MKSKKKTVILSVIHHRQNPLGSACNTNNSPNSDYSKRWSETFKILRIWIIKVHKRESKQLAARTKQCCVVLCCVVLCCVVLCYVSGSVIFLQAHEEDDFIPKFIPNAGTVFSPSLRIAEYIVNPSVTRITMYTEELGHELLSTRVFITVSLLFAYFC
jgi:hypothetical protein